MIELEIPSGFVVERQARTFMRIGDPSESARFQPVFASATLTRLDNIETCSGKTLLGKYATWTAGYQSEVVRSEEEDGRLRVDQKTDTELSGQRLRVTYRNLLIPLDGGFCADLQWVCETDSPTDQEDVFDSFVDSVKITGTPTDWEKALAADTRDSEAEYQKSLTEEASEPEGTKGPDFPSARKWPSWGLFGSTSATSPAAGKSPSIADNWLPIFTSK